MVDILPREITLIWEYLYSSLQSNGKRKEFTLSQIPSFNSLKIAEFSNRVDLDEVAHNEPPHLDLHCLPSSLWLLNMTDFLKDLLERGFTKPRSKYPTARVLSLMQFYMTCNRVLYSPFPSLWRLWSYLIISSIPMEIHKHGIWNIVFHSFQRFKKILQLHTHVLVFPSNFMENHEMPCHHWKVLPTLFMAVGNRALTI